MNNSKDSRKDRRIWSFLW